LGKSDFAALVLSYLEDDDVALAPQDLDHECRTNTWCYDVPPGPTDVPAVVSALQLVHRELSQRLTSPGTFYAWHDKQAGQLRCSLTSAPSDRLPFSAPYRSTINAVEVVTLAATDPTPGLTPYAELVDGAACSPTAEHEILPPFPVWVAPLR